MSLLQWSRRSFWLGLVCASIAVLVFFLDLNTPSIPAAGVLYVTLPLICRWFEHERAILLWTGIGIALTTLGWLLGGAATPEPYAFTNRIVSLAVLMATGVIAWQSKRTLRLLARLAYRDMLTGLWNRRALMERLADQRERSAREESRFAVILIDLDGLKKVNDHYGHAVGDRLLVQVATSLRLAVRRYETVARLGGDEFVVVVEGVASMEDARQVAERLLHGLREAENQLHYGADVGASIGVALFPDHSEEPGELLQLADAAMYLAKNAGGGVVRVAPERAARRETASNAGS